MESYFRASGKNSYFNVFEGLWKKYICEDVELESSPTRLGMILLKGDMWVDED